MTTTTLPTARTGRAFWHDVLLAGGATAIPRWTATPEPGVAEHEASVPDDLRAAADRLADLLGVPTRVLCLTAHAVVLAALSGEPEITTGYVGEPGRPPLPCRLRTGSGSWSSAALDAGRVEADLLAHRDFPVAALRTELGVAGPSFETAFDPTGAAGPLDPCVLLAVGVVDRDGRTTLRLRYRTDALDAPSAARIAGYHRTALARLVDDPGGEPRRADLLSPAELRYQLDELAGPRRELPDHRVHELFERQVRAHPDAVGCVHRGRSWTYRELNVRANRVARALLEHGLGPEDVVAVVTERTPGWLVAVLAVLKAGGAYLPIEPHFPADRIGSTLARSGCRLVLTETGATTNLEAATATRPEVATIRLDAPELDRQAGTDLGRPVAADQLAYIYFTSGSTGEPKGAMCEHAGMLNHMLAKISDLEIGPGTVVAQTAPQCFDISLWQLLSALLVGGRTQLVEQEVILDVARFVEEVVAARVGVLQVVPSYLEVVLSYLERHPRPWPDLRCVSVTGEAVKAELVQRWFAARPGIALVNAYGLTETSDDTNHHVLRAAPDADRIPLGRPIANVCVSVVDDRLRPVPLGAPGEIVFAGVCVGRGYVNDPERTRAAYRPDPHRPGGRLYRSGDYGRWRPDGTLEFLGRRDSQVKIAGFRIEIGEVENALLRVPDVRDGAVVVARRADRGGQLVAFYAGPQPMPAVRLRERLARSLPGYLVPAAFHWRERLPLTDNGKIDKKALAGWADELRGEAAAPEAGVPDRRAPRTPTERRLATAWAGVLGVPAPEIGRRDHFFDRGGTSLSAVQLAIALERAVTLRDITRHPVLADLAALLDGAG